MTGLVLPMKDESQRCPATWINSLSLPSNRHQTSLCCKTRDTMLMHHTVWLSTAFDGTHYTYWQRYGQAELTWMTDYMPRRRPRTVTDLSINLAWHRAIEMQVLLLLLLLLLCKVTQSAVNDNTTSITHCWLSVCPGSVRVSESLSLLSRKQNRTELNRRRRFICHVWHSTSITFTRTITRKTFMNWFFDYRLTSLI